MRRIPESTTSPTPLDTSCGSATRPGAAAEPSDVDFLGICHAYTAAATHGHLNALVAPSTPKARLTETVPWLQRQDDDQSACPRRAASTHLAAHEVAHHAAHHGAHEASVTMAKRVIAASGIRQTTVGIGALNEYSQALGVDIRTTSLPPGMVGRTRLDVGHVIELSETASTRRKLFTAAHELGHLLLEEATYDLELTDLLPTDYNDIEKLCDRIAGLVLMPDSWMVRVAKDAIRHHAVRRLANDLKVSYEALIIRMTDLGWPVMALRATKTRTGEWVLLGPPAGRLPSTRCEDLPLSRLDELPARFSYDGTRPAPEWHIREPVYGEVWREGTSAALWFAAAGVTCNNFTGKSDVPGRPGRDPYRPSL